MKKQVIHISLHQTSKVLATMFTFIVFIFVIIPLSLLAIAEGLWSEGLITLIAYPILYWIIFYITQIVTLWFYNFIAKRFGGVEFELKDVQKEGFVIDTQEMKS